MNEDITLESIIKETLSRAGYVNVEMGEPFHEPQDKDATLWFRAFCTDPKYPLYPLELAFDSSYVDFDPTLPIRSNYEVEFKISLSTEAFDKVTQMDDDVADSEFHDLPDFIKEAYAAIPIRHFVLVDLVSERTKQNIEERLNVSLDQNSVEQKRLETERDLADAKTSQRLLEEIQEGKHRYNADGELAEEGRYYVATSFYYTLDNGERNFEAGVMALDFKENYDARVLAYIDDFTASYGAKPAVEQVGAFYLEHNVGEILFGLSLNDTYTRTCSREERNIRNYTLWGVYEVFNQTDINFEADTKMAERTIGISFEDGSHQAFITFPDTEDPWDVIDKYLDIYRQEHNIIVNSADVCWIDISKEEQRYVITEDSTLEDILVAIANGDLFSQRVAREQLASHVKDKLSDLIQLKEKELCPNTEK